MNDIIKDIYNIDYQLTKQSITQQVLGIIIYNI